MLSKITRAYLNDDHSVRHLYNLPSTPESVPEIIRQRKKMLSCDRLELVRELESQYSGIKLGKRIAKNIQHLKEENCYTVVTGHQLNLFSGPLYFIYKIISAIKTADDLNQMYPDYSFVPVYWMATEDHDFEEINHTYISGEKVQWNTDQFGMVGDFKLDKIENVFDQLKKLLDDSLFDEEILNSLKAAYLGKKNLAEATRCLVNSLFQDYGLIIVDGNSPNLKKRFAGIVEKELLETNSYKLVSESIESFSKEFKAQVNPRELNLFYATENLRERIVKTESGFEVVNTDIIFTEEEILTLLKKYPERFSPNVILRPLYQEIVLPNIMYIGGGAELAYWLELRSLFNHYNVSYPLLQIRSSYAILSSSVLKKIGKYNIPWESLFLKKEELLKLILADDIPLGEDFVQYKKELKKETELLISKVRGVDKNIEHSVNARQKKIFNELSKLEKSIYRSVKKQHVDKANLVDTIREEVFPGNVFQERRVNVVDMLRKYGTGFIDVLYQQSDSFDRTISLIHI